MQHPQGTSNDKHTKHRLPRSCSWPSCWYSSWSGVGPHDRLTWLLEVVPILIAVPLLLLSAPTFPLTRLAYVLIAIHALILMYGGHYTYALTPFGAWMQETFGFTRNHYDRIGHLMQGFGPAIIARELLLRTSPMRPGKWLFTIVTLEHPRDQRAAMNSRSGGRRWRQARRPQRSSARRATSGTRNGTCSSRGAARSRRS